MRTFHAAENMTDEIDVDFSDRIRISDQLIDQAKQVMRLTEHTHTEQAEIEMSRSFVKMRDLLVCVRDELGFDNVGPLIPIDDNWISAYGEFSKGTTTMTDTYIKIQQTRYDDIEWNLSPILLDDLRSAVVSLYDFLAIAHAWNNNTTLDAAKSLLQLERDRRRIGLRESSIGKNLDQKDLDNPSIDPAGLANLFDASATKIRTFLVSRKIPYIVKGARGRPYRWQESIAVQECDAKFNRKARTRNGLK